MKINWPNFFSVREARPALEDLHKQADAAGPEAQNNLGVLYATGGTFPQDYTAAASCFQKAAAQGYALAQTNLGRMFAAGMGLPKDELEACAWFRRAARQGDAGAQFSLGITLHRLSLQTPAAAAHEDKIEGFMWLHLAAAQEFYAAEGACGRLNLHMSDAEVEEGRRRIAEFVAVRE
jgi:TPR repeat protein